MTDIKTLVERMKMTNQFQPNADVSTDEVVAAIDALQGEVERLKTDGACWKQLHDEVVVERDALAAKLDALEKQKPVAHCRVSPLQSDEHTRKSIVLWVNGPVEGPLYAAPKEQEDQEPREQRADWLPITNALDHAVRELGRTKEANAHDWNTAVHVFEFARGTTCTCCSSPTQWPEAYRCLDCKAVLCEACAPAHFGPDHSKRAAAAHKKDMNSTIESPAHTLTKYFKEVQDRVVSTSTLTSEDIDTIVDPYQLWDVYEDAVGEDLRQFSKNNKEQSREVAALFFELGRQAAPKALEPVAPLAKSLVDAIAADRIEYEDWPEGSFGAFVKLKNHLKGTPPEDDVGADCTPNHNCNGRMVHLPDGEHCDHCGITKGTT